MSCSFFCVINDPDFDACLKCNCNLWFALSFSGLSALLSFSSATANSFFVILGLDDFVTVDGEELLTGELEAAFAGGVLLIDPKGDLNPRVRAAAAPASAGFVFANGCEFDLRLVSGFGGESNLERELFAFKNIDCGRCGEAFEPSRRELFEFTLETDDDRDPLVTIDASADASPLALVILGNDSDEDIDEVAETTLPVEPFRTLEVGTVKD